MIYPLGPYEPDRNPRLNDQLLREADGVYPSPDGYTPCGQWVEVVSALPGAPLGGASMVSPLGESVVLAGTATGLYAAVGSGWTLLASGYTARRWRFVQFGGVAVATNGTDVLQKIDLTTLVVSVLGGSPPRFEDLGIVYDGFLVGTNYNSDVMTLAWCAAYNSESWTPAQGQSDYQTLASGGRINGIVGGEFGLILQRKRVMRMDYVGGNKIFNFAEVSSNIGCVSSNSLAQWGNLAFWLSEEGFVQWDGQPTLIGRFKVDETFRDLYGVADWETMTCAIDPVRGVVKWSMGDQTWLYDWTLQRWATLPYAATGIFSGVTRALSVDEQDPDVGAPDDNVDGVGLIAFDSAAFMGGDPRLYVFASDYRLGTFTGTPMAATFTGNDIEIFPGRRADIRFVRPDIDAASGLTITLDGKQTLAGSSTTYTTTTMQASGDMAIRASGRYHKPTIAIAAGTAWNHAKALDLVGQPGAGR